MASAAAAEVALVLLLRLDVFRVVDIVGMMVIWATQAKERSVVKRSVIKRSVVKRSVVKRSVERCIVIVASISS